jgi:hypothetical protein
MAFSFVLTVNCARDLRQQLTASKMGMQFPEPRCPLESEEPSQDGILHSKRPTTMPPHHCCSSCTRESSSTAGIGLHRRSCQKYTEHMSTVWQLKHQATVQERANSNATRGLTQTPRSQACEPESHMEIDNIVSLPVFTGSSECPHPRFNSHIYPAWSLRQRQCLYCLCYHCRHCRHLCHHCLHH